MVSLVTGTSSRGSGGSGGAAGGSLMVSAATTGPVDYNDLINKPSIPDLTPINDFMDLDFGLLSTSRAPQNKTGIFIPFYVYPNFLRHDFKKTFDDMMQILDENQDVPVLAVINPGNGPLDAGVYDSVYEILLSRLKNHNVTVMGYVKSGRDDGAGGRHMGNRPIADVETDIVNWFTYFPTIQGIFVDEAPYLAVDSADSGLGRDQTQQDVDNYLDYYNSIYRLVKTKSRSMLKRFVTVTINPGSRSAPYYDRSIYQHTGDITKVCFDQIMCSENFDFPNLDVIEDDTSATSEIRFDRSTRIAVVHSQPTYDDEKVKKLSKYWGWVYVTSNLMPNPFDDLSKVYFKEMCQTFADDAGSKTKLVSDKPNVMGNKVVQVAAGYNHTMFLMADGTVKGVGDNSQGQLGDGTTINRTTPVSVIQVTGKVTKVAVGNQHTLFLKSDRTVTCLGHSDLTTTSGLDSLEVIDIAAGFHHSVFLCHEIDQYSQRTVKIKAMGDNQYGQLGNATNDDSTGVVNVDVPGDAGVVTKVVAGDYHTVFLTSASGLGKAYAVGRGLEGQTGQTSNISTMQQVMPSDQNSNYHYRSKFNVHDIEAGGNNTVLICTDPEYEYESGKFRAAPTVVTLGDNAYYQLGVNNTEWQHQSFVQRAYIAWADGFPRAIHASVGNGHMLVQLLDSSGTIKAFGRNTEYQLADGTINNNGDFANEATDLANFDVVQVAAGNENSMFLLADGTVKCIGNNSSGQLGVGSTTDVSSLTDVLFDHRHLIGDNVGIGTVSPTEKLHVNGDVRADNVKVDNVKVTGAVLTMSTDHTFKVTVADKVDHRYPYVSGSSSNSAYYIDGVESPFLQLVAGKTYKFDVSAVKGTANVNPHPLGLYASASGGSVLTNPTFTATNDVHTLVTSETTPATFYYMCGQHPYMGNQIHVAGGATGGGGSGSSSFVGLSDTPSSLGTDGQVLKMVSGNLQFANESGGGSGSGSSDFKGLSDTPNTMTAADAGKIVTVNGTGDALEYGANFRELACEQTIITNELIIDDGELDQDAWVDLASHTTKDNINTSMNTETTVNVSQNSKVEIKAQIGFGTIGNTSNDAVGFAIRLGKKVNNVIIWGNSNGYVSGGNTDHNQNDPRFAYDANLPGRTRAWGSIIQRNPDDDDPPKDIFPINAHYIDEDPTNGVSGYNKVTYFIRVIKLFSGNGWVIGRASGPTTAIDSIHEHNYVGLPTILSATEIGSGAITSFTQEQALAGAGGTAAFNVHTSPHYGGFSGEYLHDDTYTMSYASSANTFSNGTGSAFVAYEFTVPQIVTKYILWPRYVNQDENQNARIWELCAADSQQEYENGNFTTLDSQSLPGALSAAGATEGWPTTANSAVPNTTKPSDSLYFGNHYNLSNIGAYKYYRLNITGNYGSGLVGIQEWALYGGGFTIPSQVGHSGKILKTNGTSLKWETIPAALLPAPEAADAGKIVTVNSTGNDLVYSQQKSIDFTALTETGVRATSTTTWWEIFGPTTSALAVCSGIVPQTLTSKMHIQVMLHLSGGTTDPYFQGILYRNVHVGTNAGSVRSSTPIGINTESGNFLKVSFTHKSNSNYGSANLHQENISYSFVDDLTSSGVEVGDKVTYSVKVRNRNDPSEVAAIHNTIRINRFGGEPNLYNYPTTVSTLTVTEY